MNAPRMTTDTLAALKENFGHLESYWGFPCKAALEEIAALTSELAELSDNYEKVCDAAADCGPEGCDPIFQINNAIGYAKQLKQENQALKARVAEADDVEIGLANQIERFANRLDAMEKERDQLRAALEEIAEVNISHIPGHALIQACAIVELVKRRLKSIAVQAVAKGDSV